MKQPKPTVVTLSLILTLAVGIASGAHGEDYYKEKFITFIVGYSPGGSFDAYTRLLARSMPDHIPGQPKAVVKNMTGAGGLIAANYIYNRARRDGRTIGGWGGALVLQNVLGREATKFDGRKFGWLGTPAPYNTVCSFNRQSGIESVKDWFAAKKPVTIAGFAPGSTPSDVPKLLRAALGLPLKVIEGYRGGAKARLAVEMGEVDGYCGSWQTVKSIWREAFDSGKIRVVLQTTLKSHSELEDVPLAIDYAKTDEARQLVKILDYAYSAPFKYSVPPNVPSDRLEILQKAFVEALRDPKLLATAKKSQMEVEPVGGPATAKIVRELYDMNAATKSKLRDILLPRRQN